MSEQKTIPSFETFSLGELGEVIQGSCYMLGQQFGYELAADYVRKMSGDLFVLGKDELARTHRNLADELKKEAKKLRDSFEKDYRERERAAFAELERREVGIN